MSWSISPSSFCSPDVSLCLRVGHFRLAKVKWQTLPLALRTPPRVSTFFHVFPRFTCSSRIRPYNLHLFSAYIFIPPTHPSTHRFHSASSSLVSKLPLYSLIFHPCSRSIMHPTVTSFMPFAALLSRFPSFFSFLRFPSSSSSTSTSS